MSMKSILAGAALTVSLISGSPAMADDMAAEKFATERLAAFGSGDVEALLAQYADDAVVITPMGTFSDRESIRAMVQGIIDEFALPGAKFELLSQSAVGDVVSLVWSAETAKNVYDLGAETYVLKDGRAAYQTLAFKMHPK